MPVSRVIKRVFFAVVLCIVAIWCFNEVRMPFTGNVPWSSGNTIWVIALAIVGIISLVWAYNLFISTFRSTTQANKPQAASADPQSLTKEEREQYIQALQAVDANPQSFEAWTNLGYIQHKIDENDDALASANRALRMISENTSLGEQDKKKAYARAWMVRGMALSTMDNQEDKALEALNRALEQDQNNVDAMYYKGRVYTLQENDSAAHALFDRVLALDPKYKDAFVGKSILYLATNDFGGVLAIADKYIGRFPDDPVGWRMQGTAYNLQAKSRWDEGKIEQAKVLLNQAILSFNQALKIDPSNSSIYLLKAGSFVDLGDYTQAIEILDQGLRINPGNGELLEAKAEIVGKRTKRRASIIAGTAGRMALGGGLGLAKGSGRVGKMFWDVFKDDMRKP